MDSSKKSQGNARQGKSADKTTSDTRPRPKQGSVVHNAPVQPGTGDAAAKGGDVKPVKSTLLGENGDRPAADPKTKASPAAKAPAAKADAKTDKPGNSTIPAVARDNAAKPAPSEPGAKTTVVKKTGFFPTFLGGVVAAGLGAGAMYFAVPQLPETWRPTASDPALDPQILTDQAVTAARDAGAQAGADAGAQAGADAARQALMDAAPDAPLDAAEDAADPIDAGTMAPDLTARLDAQAEQIAALDKAIAALGTVASAEAPVEPPAEARPAQDAGDASVAGLVAPVSGADDLAGLKDTVARLQSRVAELAERPSLDAQTAQKLQSLGDNAETVQAEIASAADDVRQQIAAAREQAEKLEADVMSASKAALGQAAVARLHGALAEGGDTAAALADLNAAGVETPAALQQDVPSLTSLQQGFDDAARAGLRAALQDRSQQDGAMGVIGNFLKAQTGARSVTPRDGDDADAVLSRAHAAVKAGDVTGALSQMEGLPESARQAMAGWIGQARHYAEAQAALTDLSSDAK